MIITGRHTDQIAQTQARLWVDAEIRRMDLTNGAAVAQRIAEARKGLGLLGRCRHDVSRAVWMHRELITRLMACPMPHAARA